jgi:hypothetical protein
MRINIGSDAEVINNEIYLHEGKSASLNATQFKLAESTDDYIWTVNAPSGQSSSTIYKSVEIKKGLDGVTRLVASESTYGNYDVKVTCFYKRQDINQSVDIIIHIIGVTYPNTYEINHARLGTNSDIRANNTTLTFWGAGVSSEIYVQPVEEHTATIKDVFFTLTRKSDSKVIL